MKMTKKAIAIAIMTMAMTKTIITKIILIIMIRMRIKIGNHKNIKTLTTPISSNICDILSCRLD